METFFEMMRMGSRLCGIKVSERYAWVVASHRIVDMRYSIVYCAIQDPHPVRLLLLVVMWKNTALFRDLEASSLTSEHVYIVTKRTREKEHRGTAVQLTAVLLLYSGTELSVPASHTPNIGEQKSRR